MNDRLTRVAVVGFPLMVLYGVLLTLQLMQMRERPVGAGFLAFSYALGIFVSLAVVQLRDWARQLLVILNAILCLYYLTDFIVNPYWDSICYFLVHFVVFAYFLQESIKDYFLLRFHITRKSILVVDDDVTLLKTVQHILLHKGFSVLTASTGEKGLEIAKRQRPDLIILDVILPGIKGRDVCAELKEDSETQDIPVIFLTAKDSHDDVQAEMESGGLVHITKPVQARSLFNEVKKVLGV